MFLCAICLALTRSLQLWQNLFFCCVAATVICGAIYVLIFSQIVRNEIMYVLRPLLRSSKQKKKKSSNRLTLFLRDLGVSVDNNNNKNKYNTANAKTNNNNNKRRSAGGDTPSIVDGSVDDAVLNMMDVAIENIKNEEDDDDDGNGGDQEMIDILNIVIKSENSDDDDAEEDAEEDHNYRHKKHPPQTQPPMTILLSHSTLSLPADDDDGNGDGDATHNHHKQQQHRHQQRQRQNPAFTPLIAVTPVDFGDQRAFDMFPDVDGGSDLGGGRVTDDEGGGGGHRGVGYALGSSARNEMDFDVDMQIQMAVDMGLNLDSEDRGADGDGVHSLPFEMKRFECDSDGGEMEVKAAEVEIDMAMDMALDAQILQMERDDDPVDADDDEKENGDYNYNHTRTHTAHSAGSPSGRNMRLALDILSNDLNGYKVRNGEAKVVVVAHSEEEKNGTLTTTTTMTTNADENHLDDNDDDDDDEEEEANAEHENNNPNRHNSERRSIRHTPQQQQELELQMQHIDTNNHKHSKAKAKPKANKANQIRSPNADHKKNKSDSDIADGGGDALYLRVRKLQSAKKKVCQVMSIALICLLIAAAELYLRLNIILDSHSHHQLLISSLSSFSDLLHFALFIIIYVAILSHICIPCVCCTQSKMNHSHHTHNNNRQMSLFRFLVHRSIYYAIGWCHCHCSQWPSTTAQSPTGTAPAGSVTAELHRNGRVKSVESANGKSPVSRDQQRVVRTGAQHPNINGFINANNIHLASLAVAEEKEEVVQQRQQSVAKPVMHLQVPGGRESSGRRAHNKSSSGSEQNKNDVRGLATSDSAVIGAPPPTLLLILSNKQSDVSPQIPPTPQQFLMSSTPSGMNSIAATPTQTVVIGGGADRPRLTLKTQKNSNAVVEENSIAFSFSNTASLDNELRLTRTEMDVSLDRLNFKGHEMNRKGKSKPRRLRDLKAAAGDSNKKKQITAELVQLPVREFNRETRHSLVAVNVKFFDGM